jgi:hypothetical protein
MSQTEIIQKAITAPSGHDEWPMEERWAQASARLLAAVDESRRSAAAEMLRSLHRGATGLRDWVMAIAWRGAVLPDALPGELVDVYLFDSEAAPLHECEDCGVAIPVKKCRVGGYDEPERRFFTRCPICGGRTGWYLRHARLAETGEEAFADDLRRAKPR